MPIDLVQYAREEDASVDWPDLAKIVAALAKQLPRALAPTSEGQPPCTNDHRAALREVIETLPGVIVRAALGALIPWLSATKTVLAQEMGRTVGRSALLAVLRKRHRSW